MSKNVCLFIYFGGDGGWFNPVITKWKSHVTSLVIKNVNLEKHLVLGFTEFNYCIELC